MSGFKKFIWGLFGLVLIVQALLYLALIYGWGVILTSIQAMMVDEAGYYFMTGLLVVTLVGGIVLLVIALFAPSLNRQLWLRQPKGRLRISKSTVTGMVQQSLAHHFDLADVTVNPRLVARQKQILLRVDAVTFNTEDLSGQANLIRQQIIEDVQNYLGVSVKKVNLRLKRAADGQKVSVI